MGTGGIYEVVNGQRYVGLAVRLVQTQEVQLCS